MHLAADIVLFRDPLDPASNPLADAEMYMAIDAGPTAVEPAGAVNTGMIGMRDGLAVRHPCLPVSSSVCICRLSSCLMIAIVRSSAEVSQLRHLQVSSTCVPVPVACAASATAQAELLARLLRDILHLAEPSVCGRLAWRPRQPDDG